MHIATMLQQRKPTFSFEFYPPRNLEGYERLFHTIRVLAPLHPAFVSVTFGAGGHTRSHTTELVKRIQTEIGLETMAHLTCVNLNRKEMAGILDELQSAGVENILALRGDIPEGESHAPTADGFEHASDLVEFIKSGWDFCVGVAGYPETHPESENPEKDLDYLQLKVECGAEFIITQLFFENRLFEEFRSKVVRRGIRVPMLAGIMPILGVHQIHRFAGTCGASIPSDLNERLEAVADDPEAVHHIGMFHATIQCLNLLVNGAAGIHFYTLNCSSATRAIFQLLRTNPPGYHLRHQVVPEP